MYPILYGNVYFYCYPQIPPKRTCRQKLREIFEYYKYFDMHQVCSFNNDIAESRHNKSILYVKRSIKLQILKMQHQKISSH